jgi:symplekin
MSHRGGSTAMAGNRRDSNSMSVDDALLPEPDNLSDDDDNAQDDVEDEELDNEDPLLLAIDDLEGRVAVALEDIQLHPGISSTDSNQGVMTIHDELAALIRPVIEVAAHTAPSVARTYHRGVGPEGVENSMDDVYQRIVADLVLPVMLEIAQSDPILTKRGAGLEFFRTLWKEYHKSGSWLDITTTGLQQGPYGAGGSHHHTVPANVANNPAMRAAQKRRQQKRLVREGEILRYWIEASNALLNAVDFNSTDSTESEIISRGIISASAAIRPAFSHLSQRIKDADDRGAARMYTLVMRTVEAVLKKMFLGSDDSMRAACIKFLEIVILCCSRRSKDAASRRRTQTVSD